MESITRQEMLKLSLLGGAALLLPLGVGSGGSYPAGREAPTSFGTLILRRAEKVPAYTADEVAGLTYGIREAAPTVANVLVQVSVVLTNRLDRPVDGSPRRFRLAADENGRRTAPSDSTLPSGALGPGRGVSGALSFVAPRDGSELFLEYLDPDGAPVRMALGRTQRTTATAGGGSSTGGPSRGTDGHH